MNDEGGDLIPLSRATDSLFMSTGEIRDRTLPYYWARRGVCIDGDVRCLPVVMRCGRMYVSKTDLLEFVADLNDYRKRRAEDRQ